MQASPVSLTLSRTAKNIHGMQLPFQKMSPHLHVAPTGEYHCYPDVMFTFIPSAISDGLSFKSDPVTRYLFLFC